MYLGDRGYRGDTGNRGVLIILLAVYAAAVEFVQGELLVYRSFDMLDMFAGWTGLVLMALYENYRS